MPKGQSSNSNTGSQYNLPLNQSHPGENQGPSHPSNSFSNYQHPLPSANSWASNNSRGNSFAPSSAPPPALLPPGWPQHQNTNSVPSPPQNQEDFQRAGSVSFALTSLELKMHHHIDSTYNSLSRLITDKLDRMTDQTIRRLDNLEDTCNTGLKALKGEVRDLRKHVTNLLGDMEDMKQGRDGTIESVKGIDVILQALERHIEEHACKCQQSAAEQSASEPEYERRHRSEATSRSAYRRTESAHPTVGQGESRQQHRSGASHSSNVTRASATGGRRDRSNSLNVQQPAGRMSDERSRRREYYAGLGAARGPAPDLRDHPAFRDRQHVQQEAYQYGDNQNDTSTVLDELPYETPSLSDGKWYEQAYGKR